MKFSELKKSLLVDAAKPSRKYKVSCLFDKPTLESRSVRSLTLLVFLFAPLSFSCSLFGMNIVEFGTGSLSLWIWPALAVPITVIAIIPVLPDMGVLGRQTWQAVKWPWRKREAVDSQA